jgi:hypothetical protein
VKYEGESVNRSQMDIKRKICDIRTWEKHLFLDRVSTNIDTLVLSLYQYVETESVEVFWLLSQTLPHLHFNLLVISEIYVTFHDAAVNRFTRQTFSIVNRKYIFMNILCIESFCQQKKPTTERCSSVVYFSNTVAILTTETSLWTCVCASATYTVTKLDCAAT